LQKGDIVGVKFDIWRLSEILVESFKIYKEELLSKHIISR